MVNTQSIRITPELLVLIAETEFKGAWHALGILAPERLRALRRVVTVERIGSSTRIKGGKLTDREVERLLASWGSGNSPDVTNRKSRRCRGVGDCLP